MLKIKTYRDAAGKFRWSAVDRNNKIIADSAESYDSEGGLYKALHNVVNEFRGEVQYVKTTGKKLLFDPPHPIP